MLKRIRSSTSPAVLALMLAGTSLTTSCSKDGTVAPATAPAQEQQFTGQDLFKGLFFLEGPVARKLPYLDAYVSMLDKERQRDPGLAARKTAHVNELMQTVVRLEPGYLADLKAAVASKDFGRIDQALLHGAQLVEAATLLSLDADQQQQYQQAKTVLAQMDLSKYNFRDDADIRKFTAAAKAQLAGSNLIPTTTPEDMNVMAKVREFAVFFATEIGIVMINTYVSWIATNVQERASTDLSAKASLEKETLIKQIAFNLN